MHCSTQDVLLALLLDRFVPLHDEKFELKARCDLTLKLLEELKALSAPLPAGADTQKINQRTQAIIQAYALLKQNKKAEAEKLYEEALQTVMEGLELTRGDQKKWPALDLAQKSTRILTNYYYDQPERFALEKPYRELNTLSHLQNVQEFLGKNEILLAEKEVGFAQEEIRHVLALALGIDLIGIREDAETLSQTSNRPEREVTIEIFKQQINKCLNSSSLLAKNIAQFCEQDLMGFVRPLPAHDFKAKVVQGLKSEEELVGLLREQYQNLDLHLDASAQINWKNFFEKLLYLPNPHQHHYFRMPDVDHIANVKIWDAQGKLRLHFDAESRLVYAPSVEEMRSGKLDENPAVLDVAVIGGGPGGISAGVNLTAMGVFRYAIFEKSEANSTVRDIWSREKEADTFYSGPPGPIAGLVGMQDTTRAVFLNRMNSFLDYFHVNLRRKEPVNKIARENSLWSIETPQGKYLAKNVLMTAGRYGKPRLLKWEEGTADSDIRKSVVRGVEVDDIENASVLVIGGGNTAFDNVKSLSGNGSGRKKNTIYVSYHKKPFNVPVSLHVHNNDQFLQWEAEGKVKILWNTNTAGVEKVEENGKTRFKMNFREGETPTYIVVDYFAPAVGWMMDREMMEAVGLAFKEENKNPDINPNTQAAFTTQNAEKIPLTGLYVAGDYAEQKSVPLALSSNYRAAKAIAERLRG
ncbi:MAG: NAD(P)-binding domain-containing protein [Deltaproteobacteria bacterium]|nr:NAD(P)-binding domain-containing protein [Deltaproteobacteria bacterium]